jgi:hypothetical protein
MTQTNRQANNSRGEHFDQVYPRGRVLYSPGEHFDVLFCKSLLKVLTFL